MVIPLDSGQAEKSAEKSNDFQTPIEREAENGVSTNKKEKGDNGFMVSVTGESIAASSIVLAEADKLVRLSTHREFSPSAIPSSTSSKALLS